MNSIKTVAVVAVFLGVVYGVYQVINNQEPYIENDAPIVDADGNEIVGPLGIEIDPTNMTDEELDAALFGDGSEFETEDDSMASGDFDFNFDTGSDEESGESFDSSDSFSDDRDQSATDEISNTGSMNAFETPAHELGIDKPSATPPSTSPTVDMSQPKPNNAFGSANNVQKNSEFTSQNEAVANPASTQPDLNNGFTSQTPNAVDLLEKELNAKANQAQAKAEELKSEATAVANSIPDFMKAAGDRANQFAGQTKEQSRQAETNVKDAAANAFNSFAAGAANKASEFLAPKQETRPSPATDNRVAANEERAETLGTGDVDLTGALGRAQIQIEQGNFREALEGLSVYYGDPRLSDSQRRDLFEWLDPLAGKVIYSTEHLISNAYIVRPGDSLEKIAADNQVSAQLIYNINRANISNPRLLTPGTPLKILQGPFNATINRASNELTLFLGKMYAGRFVVSMGEASPTQTGRFTIKQKSETGHDYIASNGSIIASNDPANPYGKYWMELDNGSAIHSSSTSGNPDDKRGSISMSPIDAEDVYGILTAGSQVTIR